MRHFLKLLMILLVSLTASSALIAKEKAIGKPDSVVYVQEMTTTFQVMFNVFCPVSSAGKFQQYCKKDKRYNLKQPIVNPNVDWIKTGKFKYMAQWVPAKAAGTYAFVAARGATASYSLKETTTLARFAPGTVVWNLSIHICQKRIVRLRLNGPKQRCEGNTEQSSTR